MYKQSVILKTQSDSFVVTSIVIVLYITSGE